MGDNISQLDEAQALTQLLETAEHSDESGLHVSGEAVSTIAGQFIALIEAVPSYASAFGETCSRRFHCKFTRFRKLLNCNRNPLKAAEINPIFCERG